MKYIICVSLLVRHPRAVLGIAGQKCPKFIMGKEKKKKALILNEARFLRKVEIDVL